MNELLEKFKQYSLAIAIVLAIVVFINIFIDHQKETITEKVEAINGEVVEIDMRFFDKGPFWYKGFGDQTYKFTYLVEGKKKIGWVNFGTLVSSWKMDKK